MCTPYIYIYVHTTRHVVVLGASPHDLGTPEAGALVRPRAIPLSGRSRSESCSRNASGAVSARLGSHGFYLRQPPYTYIDIYVYIYLDIHVDIHTYRYIHMHILRVCGYIYIYIYAQIYMHVCINVYRWTDYMYLYTLRLFP